MYDGHNVNRNHYLKGVIILIKVFCALKNVMDKEKMNIKAVQEQTRLSRTTIGNLIHHRSTGIQFDTLSVLCSALNCNPGDLLIKHDIELEFNTIKNEIIDISELKKESSNDDERTKKLANFDINCIFKLDNDAHDINFQIESTFSYTDKYLDIEEYVPSILFNQFINDNNFPYYIQDYITNELRTFFNGQIMLFFSENN